MSTPVFTDTDRTSAARSRLWRHNRSAQPSRIRGVPRRSIPHLALGALLVVACATAFTVVSTQLDERAPVLALARPVTVGQVLTAADLREIRIAADTDVPTVPSSEVGTVVGATVAVSLPAGTLLTPAALGDALVPPSGEAIVGLALAPGQFPPEVAPGGRVLLVLSPGSGSGRPPPEAPRGWDATVTAVQPTATDARTVVSVQLGVDEARQVAAGAGQGQVTVVLVSRR